MGGGGKAGRRGVSPKETVMLAFITGPVAGSAEDKERTLA